MNRLQQDAADSLQAYEQQAAFKASERARWARANSAVLTGVWSAPPLSEKERMEREQQINEGSIPF